MVDTIKLADAFKKSGLKNGYISRRLNISYNSLANKINNRTEFKASELTALQDILNLPNDKFFEIFLAKDKEVSVSDTQRNSDVRG